MNYNTNNSELPNGGRSEGEQYLHLNNDTPGNQHVDTLYRHIVFLLTCVVETSAWRRYRRPGDQVVEQVESEVVEGNPHRLEVIEHGGNNGKRPVSVRGERIVETNALCQDPALGG